MALYQASRPTINRLRAKIGEIRDTPRPISAHNDKDGLDRPCPPRKGRSNAFGGDVFARLRIGGGSVEASRKTGAADTPGIEAAKRDGAVPPRKIIRQPLRPLHAIPHIELNAIDLAWDIIARFWDEELPRSFFDDCVAVADDEARHFAMISDRMGELGGRYGDLPTHDGLWQVAERTGDDVLARLALVPMVLEARGLT